jgi:glycine dehydrogenase
MKEVTPYRSFDTRHLGINESDLQEMLKEVGVESLDQLIYETIPDDIRLKSDLKLPKALAEHEYLEEVKQTGSLNKLNKSFIGLGYYGTLTPSVILRNIFQNPGWYTQYTPYQAEISQGRLEALLNFQTVVADLTGLPLANASLLDEGTAAAEAMAMFYNLKNKRAKDEPVNEFLVSNKVFPQTVDVLKTRAAALDIKIIIGDWRKFEITDKTFGILLQYPSMDGGVIDYSSLVEKAQAAKVNTVVAADLLSLTLLKPPGEWGADVVVGNTQRFGVPMGFGGPHAAYFATTESFKRQLPGRIIGISIDSQDRPAYRMALQTREQHIRREKATSNICTAQALLAIMAGAYAVYHGPQGLKNIAKRIHQLTQMLDSKLLSLGYSQCNDTFFDTLCIEVSPEQSSDIHKVALEHNLNFFYGNKGIGISLDETTEPGDVDAIANVFAKAKGIDTVPKAEFSEEMSVPAQLARTSEYLTNPVFNDYQTETKLMRYLKRLENKDLSLMHSMIPLGSCTMKLNAATELFPVSWPEFSSLHPFTEPDQVRGYHKIFDELENWLSEITGFAACSLQPNSGAQGEFAGLAVISAYHKANGDSHRNIALIPSSAHGTNPASAVMAGMKVVVTKCDDHGNIDIPDLKEKALLHKDNLAALLVTYPSTHGVFEAAIKEICEIIHDNGGMVYMDGANMNAQVGFTSPGIIGADVCHLNLHKTFAIPHGGGGPGVGPICVNEKLKPFLPGHKLIETGGHQAITAISSAPWGSASVVLVSHAYIRMMGNEGLKMATKIAILNANYIKAKLEKEYPILYAGDMGRCAHELIVDLRPFKDAVGAEDVAKRLMDYGFHAPTLSFPVAGTIMIEPTESESKDELDRFCDALLEIKKEIVEIQEGKADHDSNVLTNAPHTAQVIASDEWPYAYSREKAAYPLPYLREYFKFWPASGRINNAYGDRHLICTCIPIEAYADQD